MSTPDPTTKPRIALGVLFCAAGIAHFAAPGIFDRVVPEYLARYRTAVSLGTGALQIVGGILLFMPRMRLVARWVNLTLLVPTLVPAINQSRHPESVLEAGFPPRLAKLAPLRVFAQLGVIVAAWRATRPIPEVQK
jgi:uncharacterized membrane protein